MIIDYIDRYFKLRDKVGIKKLSVREKRILQGLHTWYMNSRLATV